MQYLYSVLTETRPKRFKHRSAVKTSNKNHKNNKLIQDIKIIISYAKSKITKNTNLLEKFKTESPS